MAYYCTGAMQTSWRVELDLIPRSVSRFALLLLLTPSPGLADVIPEPEPGQRYLEQRIALDMSALPADRALLAVHLGRRGADISDRKPEPIGGSVRTGNGLELFSVPRAAEERDRTVGQLREAGVPSGEVIAPFRQAVPEASRYRVVERRVRVTGAAVLGVEVVEDALLDERGDVVCRRPPLHPLEFDEGQDPCDAEAPKKRRQVFLRRNRVALSASGAAAVVLVAVGAVALRRRRQRSPK